MEVDKNSQAFVMEPIKTEDESTVLSDMVKVDYSKTRNASEEVRALSPGAKVWIVLFGTGNSVLATSLEIIKSSDNRGTA